MFERLEKMDRRALVALVVAVGVALLILSGVAHAIRQAGWNEGFLIGMLSSNGGAAEGGAALNPYLAARGYGMHGWGWHPFGLIGGFFRFLFFGFLIMAFFRFIACRRWAHFAGQQGSYSGGPWGHHGCHHWHSEQGQPQPEQPKAPQTDASTAPTNDPIPGSPHQPQPTSWTQV